ncbi:hypothetical protein [Streptomyces sp. NPDC058620]|uniref:hypothetical protein n=1 Tax=Streptomyces sp. NPDC058620 TaxID=3346560 RepID=UPI003659A06B
MNESLVSVDLSDVSDDLRRTFTSIAGSTPYGNRAFPPPEQYWRIVDSQHVTGAADLATLAVLAQLDWHLRGQTGCQFARLAARDASTLRWDHLVILENGHGGPALYSQLEIWLQAAATDPSVEVLSIMWPNLREPDRVVDLITELTDTTAFWLEEDFIHDGRRHLHLRYPVTDGVQAWVMAFAPFSFLPNTRRGPFMELAIRIKEKPEWLFHRLNQDRDIAHLADVPMDMSDKYWEDRWRSTLRRTRMILGGEPDYVSAAKATLAVPVPHETDRDQGHDPTAS